MKGIKETRKYYFSVEGETEKWYFEWLLDKINAEPSSKFKVSFDCKVQKSPVKRVKSLSNINKVTIYHIFDYESNESVYIERFNKTLDSMREAMKIGKQIDYRLGYSNLTFDLWIILHKRDLKSSITERQHYLQYINRAFDENFESMDKYKKETNFKRILSKLSLKDVNSALKRAEKIMDYNSENYSPVCYGKFTYYRENPSLTVGKIIEKIFMECGILY